VDNSVNSLGPGIEPPIVRESYAKCLHGTAAYSWPALDARGAAMGSLALAAFALMVWKLLPRHNAAVILTAALGIWCAIALLLWRVRKLHPLRHF